MAVGVRWLTGLVLTSSDLALTSNGIDIPSVDPPDFLLFGHQHIVESDDLLIGVL